MGRKNKKLTIEEKLQLERENGLRDIKREIIYANEPTYYFNVGDKVKLGMIKESVVEEVLYGGKAYVLRCTMTDTNYGNSFDYETYRVVMWTDVRPITNDKTKFAENQNIRLNFYNINLDSLINRYYHFGIDMSPDYQRDYVWDQYDKELLIDSIFKNIDIGKFAFIKIPYINWSEKNVGYEILDGKQRLSTIIEFYENRFSYKGKYYNDLSTKDKTVFENHTVSVADTEEANKKEILKCFLLLNRAGKVMDKKHLDKVEKMLDELD